MPRLHMMHSIACGVSANVPSACHNRLLPSDVWEVTSTDVLCLCFLPHLSGAPGAGGTAAPSQPLFSSPYGYSAVVGQVPGAGAAPAAGGYPIVTTEYVYNPQPQYQPQYPPK